MGTRGMKWFLVNVAVPLLVAVLPPLLEKWRSRNRLHCAGCGETAPALPGKALRQLGWSVDDHLRLRCPTCSPDTEAPA